MAITYARQNHQRRAVTLQEPKPAVLGESSGVLTIRGESKIMPELAVPIPSRPLNFSVITARHFLVYDAGTKTVLAERKSHEKTAIASLTKLLTALVVYRNSNFEEVVSIQKNDLVSERPVLGFVPGNRIKVGDLFNAMLVGSANDAAAALSHVVERSEQISFPILMNTTARELGMDESNFSNALGFDTQSNFSTAHDLALLTDAVRQYTAFLTPGKLRGYSFSSEDGATFKIAATNKLLGIDPEIAAIKTGFTEQAQGAMITSATRGGHTVIIIVLGSPNREADTQQLKDKIFDSYIWR